MPTLSIIIPVLDEAEGIAAALAALAPYRRNGAEAIVVDGGSSDGTELTYGLGVQFDFTPKIGVRGQWQRYDTDREIDVLSVGVVFRF